MSGAGTSEASRSGADQRCDEPSPAEHIAANGRAQEKKVDRSWPAQDGLLLLDRLGSQPAPHEGSQLHSWREIASNEAEGRDLNPRRTKPPETVFETSYKPRS